MRAFCFGSSALQLPLGLAVPEVDGAAARAARAHRRRRLQVPDARLVQERARQQRADRADVDDVVGVRVVRRSAPSSAGADQRVVAAVLDAERVGLRDLAREAHAARAQDAALVVEHDALGQLVVLGRVRPWRRARPTARRCTRSGSPAACTRRPCRRCRSRPGGSA